MSWLGHRVRGFRLVDLAALGVLTVLILGVYLAKTIAGRERTEIARVERQIEMEKARIRLLRAEVSHLEQPARIERLAVGYLGLAPTSLKRETTLEALAEVASKPLAAPAVAVEVTPDPILTAAPQPAAPLAAPIQVAEAAR